MKRKKRITLLSAISVLIGSLLTIVIIATVVPRDVKAGNDSYVYEEDFEYLSVEEASAAIGKDWYLELVSSWGSSTKIIEEGGNRFLRLTWIDGRLLRNQRTFNTSTTFSGRFRVNQTGAAGGFVFVRTTLTPYTATRVDGSTQVINEYENDGYDDDTYAYGVGATGVYIKFQGTKLQINVRTQEDTNDTYTKGLGRKYIEVDIPNGKNSVNEFVNISIEDKNNAIKIYAENQLIAVVEYSNSVDGIYRNAILKDSNGNVMFNITNARIADSESTFAIANRGAIIDVDDLRIEAEKAPIKPQDIALEAPVVQRYPTKDEYQDGKRLWQGIPGIEKAEGGRLWSTWYSGSTTENEYNWVVLYTSSDDGASWSGPAVVIDPVYPVRAFDPVLWTDPDGRMWLFWSQSYYMFDGRAGVWAIYTDNPDDANPTWSEPVRIANGVAMNKPIVLSDGTWMLPTAVWGHSKDSTMGVEINSNVYVSTDKGKNWSYRGSVKGYEGNRNADENMVVELSDGSLLMYIRTTLGIEKSYSYDKGFTWTNAVNANISKTVSRFYISKLNSGNLILVYHNPPGDDASRSYLTAAISTDDGATWQGNLVLDERNGVSYPDGFQAEDGRIYVIYDRNRGSDMEILMAVITEEDIMAGKIVSDNSRLKFLINNNGKIAPKTPEDLKNTGITPNDGGRVAILENGKPIFSNRPDARVFVNLPDKLKGIYYIYSPIEQSSAAVIQSGDVYVITKRDKSNGNVPMHSSLIGQGFVRDTSIEPFRLFSDQLANEDTVVYHKFCNAGEEISFGNWAVIAYKPAEGIQLENDIISQRGDLVVNYSNVENGSWYALMPQNLAASKEKAIAWKDISGTGSLKILKDRTGGILVGDLGAGIYDLVFMKGSTEIQRVSITVEYVDPKPASVYWLFDKPESVAYGSEMNNLNLVYNTVNKSVMLDFDSDGNSDVTDPYVYFKPSGTSINADDYPIISFLIRKSEGSPSSGQVFFQTNTSGGLTGQTSVSFPYQSTAEWQLVTVDLSENQLWSGELVRIRLDPFGNCKDTDEYEIRYIAFFKSLDAANKFNGSFDDTHTVKVEEVENGVVMGGGVYEKGAEYSLNAAPADGYEFGGWYDKVTGEVISTSPSFQGVANADVNVFARFFSVEGKNGFVYQTLGAQVRLAEPQGLRFVTQVNKESIPESATNIEFGTLVTLERNLEGRNNTELLKGAEGFKYLDIKGERFYRDTDEFLWFTAVITDIPVEEYDTNFVARSYITYTDAEGTHTIYDSPIERSVNIVKANVQGGS